MSDWDEVPDEVERRSYTCLIYGDTGTGRTRLALTAPGPIALAHTAEKIDGVVQFAKKAGTEVRTHNFGVIASGSEQQISDRVKPVWDQFVIKWNGAVDEWARTAVCDTTTEAWELLRLAYFGELNPKGRIQNLYGPVNQRWRSVFKRNKMDWRCNVIMIAQTKDEYKDVFKDGKKVSEKTGNTVLVGQRELPIISDIILRCDKVIDRDRGAVYTATVEKAWAWGEHEGTTFENDECRLPYIVSWITGIPEAEWTT